ncbi:DUF3048 domain-containing protein [Pontibacillus salicampi]|uniref:DUF3048 domain-containing protein n=1 Tax=Pontibacillus salicampi TaxID=1449801 RepID=A0ABV6LMW7_9BACI
MSKRLLWLFFLLLMVLAACSSQDEQVQIESNDGADVTENTSQEEGEGTEQNQDEASAGYNVFPLTGKRTDKPVNQRVIAVMVNNHSSARPQTGLTKADVVYEVLAEGSITRFLALFHSEQPDVIGPVRSAREYYVKLAQSHEALFVYHGAATHIENQMNGWIDHLNGTYYDNNGTLFQRVNFRSPPHNSYLQWDGIEDTATSKGISTRMNHDSLPFLNEEDVKAIKGDSAATVRITYSSTPQEIVEYQFNEGTGQYTRWNDGVQTVDYETNEPMLLENVFIVEANHKVIDGAGRRAVDLESGGNGYLIQQGQVQEVQWRNKEGRIVPYQDGEPTGFVPGKTWVNIVPENPGINQSVSISAQ